MSLILGLFEVQMLVLATAIRGGSGNLDTLLSGVSA